MKAPRDCSRTPVLAAVCKNLVNMNSFVDYRLGFGGVARAEKLRHKERCMVVQQPGVIMIVGVLVTLRF